MAGNADSREQPLTMHGYNVQAIIAHLLETAPKCWHGVSVLEPCDDCGRVDGLADYWETQREHWIEQDDG